MSDGKREIEDLRAEISRLDAQLLAMIEKRAKASRRIGELRRGHMPSLPLGDRAALAALVAKAGHDLPSDAVREIFRQIFAACTALELPVKVAYPAPEGGAAHAAARGRFGTSSSLEVVESTALAIEEVARNRVEFAVVPLETRAEGPVQATITALLSRDLKIVATLDESWEIDLVNKSGHTKDIERVVATAADRALCAKLLASLGPDVSVVDVRTPLVACQIAVEDHGAAALAGESLAATLGLEVARRNVLDEGEHRVRYAVVGHRPSSRSGSDLTSFVFSVDDGAGALLDVLKQFAERGINLTKIHSRPTDRDSTEAWGYLFFVEIIGHATDRTVVSAFEEVKRTAKLFKVLGSYPSAA